MLLIDNINILKKAYPSIWDKIEDWEDSIDANLIRLEETRNGDKTLFIDKDGKKTYIHSKYNPLREAESIIEEYNKIKDSTTVIFYGTGLGYHIDLFLEKHPNINYYIYEPVPELLCQYLSNKPLKKLPGKNLKNIILGSSIQENIMFLNNVIDKSAGDIILAELPIHKQIFHKQYECFLNLFKTILEDKRTSMHTNYAYQGTWILNSMKNFGEVLSTPNILLEKKGKFKDKPAILVAAGPSLNEEIENIRYIKENGLAYIFSVGSAINTLIYNDIYPDAACTYDPTTLNKKVFEIVKEKDIHKIPMIFGSSVGYETLLNYPGDKYHMVTSQDTVSNYYLKNKDDKSIDIVQDAPSIAVVTLQLLYELGFSPIILVGQNLAYRGKERHSEGVYYSKEVTNEEIDNGIWVKDVYGNEVLTNEGFNKMRQQMEHYVKEFPDLEITNTTKGGAHIEGTAFVELKEIMKNNFNEHIVEKEWLKGNKTNYDKGYLQSRSEDMDKAFKRALKLVDEYYNILNRIDKFISNRKFNQLEKMYIKLDNVLGKIERNDFFTTFILPMNRVHYKILANSIDSLNEEVNLTEKGRKIVDSFKRFMDICKSDMEKIEHTYEEMKEAVNEFLKSK